MSSILDKKIQELKDSDQYECWYLVKQPTDFSSICYLVLFLEEFKKKSAKNNVDMSLSDYINIEVENINKKKGLSISKNYRALRVAVFFGLITMNPDEKSCTYEHAEITDTFKEIKFLTNGDFEKKELYSNIITRQIEKIFVSSVIDEEHNYVRKNYRLYPVMLLYKILLELGKSKKSEYSITITEYKYLVATTKKYEDYLDTLLQIIELRNNSGYNDKLEVFKKKFDNRMIQALKQLDTLTVDKEKIIIPDNKIEEVSQKINSYENCNLENLNINYLEFLGSTKSLLNLCNNEIENKKKKYDDKSINRVTGGENIILYGVPGSGKSFIISEEYCTDESKIERIVFHPDYMNTDFIGQILPIVKDNLITYNFIPGPFTRIMKKAYDDPKNKYYLIIEEINRGNAPAIFGDVFQLLDRNIDGDSTYAIKNSNIANVVYGDADRFVSIPSNLSILATMNTADQNVFTLDTAFQRRWIMRLIKNEVSKAEHANIEILDTGITWEVFNNTINEFILVNNVSNMSSEDKRLGAYFITKDILESENPSMFSEKVIKYLWDDVFKFSRNKLFDSSYHSLEKVIEDFNNFRGFERFNIFTVEVKDHLKNNTI